MAKADTRVCRYPHCKHNDKTIDLTTDKYVKDGGSYYHEECYRNKANIQLIKNLWHDHISQTVVYSQLISILNQLIFKDNISSDYIVFVVQYCIDNQRKLRYPPGLKYCIDDQVIKNAYNKKIRSVVHRSDFSVNSETDSKEDNSPKFTVNNKPLGFKSILGR